jgi:hypothetical protein
MRRRALRPTRRGAHGQAVVEGMLTLLVIVVIGISSFALAVRIVAQLQYESAVANAAASTLSVPLGSGDRAQRNAEDAFLGTLRSHGYIDPGHVTCVSNGYFGGGDQAAAGQLITCTADGVLKLADFPLPIGPNVSLHASASVVQPAYRQCDSVATTSGSSCR